MPDNFATYYIVQFGEPWQNVALQEVGGGNRAGLIRFPTGSNRSLQARTATSFISFEQASRNLQLEVGDRPPAELRAQREQRGDREAPLTELADCENKDENLIIHLKGP